jgi:hypothetical protein
MEVPEALFWTPHSSLLHSLRAANQATLPSLKRDLERHHAWLLSNVGGFRPAGDEQTAKIVRESKHVLIQNRAGKVLMHVRLRQATIELGRLLVSGARASTPAPPPAPGSQRAGRRPLGNRAAAVTWCWPPGAASQRGDAGWVHACMGLDRARLPPSRPLALPAEPGRLPDALCAEALAESQPRA